MDGRSRQNEKHSDSLFVTAVLFALLFFFFAAALWGQTARWPEEKANAWYAQQPWLVGS